MNTREKRPLLEDLPSEVREKLLLLLSKFRHELLPEEVRFLKARREYLSDKDLVLLEDVLEEGAKSESASPSHSPAKEVKTDNKGSKPKEVKTDGAEEV